MGSIYFESSVADFTPAGGHSYGNVRDASAGVIYTISSISSGARTASATSRLTKWSDSTLAAIASLDITTGENEGLSIAQDSNYVYVGSADANGVAVIHRVSKSTFLVTSTLTLNSGENYAMNMIVDGANMYVLCDTNPTQIVKINLSTFTRTSAITLNAGERVQQGVITGGFLYVYGGTTINVACKVVKINLTTFTRTSAITLNADECIWGTSGGILADATYLYVITYLYTDSFAKVVRVNLGTFTRTDALTLTHALELRSYGIGIAFISGTHLYVVAFGATIDINLSTFTITSSSNNPVGPQSTIVASPISDGTTVWATSSFASTSRAPVALKITLSTLTRSAYKSLPSGNVGVRDSVKVGSYIYEITSSDIYNNESKSESYRVVKRDATTYAVISTLEPLSAPGSLGGITSDGSYLYVSCVNESNDAWIIKIDPTTLTVSATSSNYANGPHSRAKVAYYNGDLFLATAGRLIKVSPTTLAEISSVALTGNSQNGSWSFQILADGAGRIILIKGELSGNNTYFTVFNSSSLATLVSATLISTKRFMQAKVTATHTFIVSGYQTTPSAYKVDNATGTTTASVTSVGAYSDDVGVELDAQYFYVAHGDGKIYRYNISDLSSAGVHSVAPNFSGVYHRMTLLTGDRAVVYGPIDSSSPLYFHSFLMTNVEFSPATFRLVPPAQTLNKLVQIYPPPLQLRVIAPPVSLSLSAINLAPVSLRLEPQQVGLGIDRFVLPTTRGHLWSVSATEPVVKASGYVWVDISNAALPRVYQYVSGAWVDQISQLAEATTRVTFDGGGASSSATPVSVVTISGIAIPADETIIIDATIVNSNGLADITDIGIELNNVVVMSGVAMPGTGTGEAAMWRIIIPRRDKAGVDLGGRSYIVPPGTGAHTVTALASVPQGATITQIELKLDPNGTSSEIRNVLVRSLLNE